MRPIRKFGVAKLRYELPETRMQLAPRVADYTRSAVGNRPKEIEWTLRNRFSLKNNSDENRACLNPPNINNCRQSLCHRSDSTQINYDSE